MNIKRAKQEIKDTIEAYFLKNEWGEYEIPAIRLIRSHTIPDRVPSDFHLFQNIPLMEKSRQSRNIP